jgi:hypothetical protein
MDVHPLLVAEVADEIDSAEDSNLQEGWEGSGHVPQLSQRVTTLVNHALRLTLTFNNRSSTSIQAAGFGNCQ